MRYDTKMKLSALAVVGVCAALFAAVFFASRVGDERGRADDCVESPPQALDLRGVTVHGDRFHGHTVCGLYSRPAMPDAIRCYELNRGCSK